MTTHPQGHPATNGSRQVGGTRPIHTLVCANCGTPNQIGPSERGAPHCGKCGKPLAWVVDANESTFEVEARAQPTVVLDLWAPWCGPCRFVSPILDELAHHYAGRLKVVKVNVDENQGLARRFDAMSIPTIIVMRDGAVVNRIVGAAPKEQLEAQIAPYLKPPKAKADAASA
ncbi:MAG: thioredoxin 2 [Chloroflexota bacterium]|nr:thioredoxin 2 [Chloroflexota bacterium]